MPLPNDPLVNLQWYLKNTGQAGGTAGIDINVENVWTDYTGTGIRIGIYDDGVQVTHPDLAANHLASLQPVIGGVTHAGTPITAGNNHGTPVAGIIVATGNNNTGVTGVAYGASFGTARFLGADGTLAQQLLDAQTLYDVTNHSWGSTRSYFADGNGDSTYQLGATTGRGGLGVIMVKAAGNERVGAPGDEPVGRDANDSGANTNRHAIVVGATLNTGFVADYSSPSAVLLVSAPAGPSATGLDQDISTDRTGTDGYNNGTGTPTNEADYSAFNGTSAATPVTSGVAALILQANNTLGWRDVQEILAYSARHVGSAIGAAPAGSEADVWAYNAARDWNGGGLHFSNDYGFGMVDALTAVRLAETWRVGSPVANTSANEQTATATVTQAAQAIPDNNGQSITYTFNITNAISIESANINLALNHTAVGDLRIVLTSPNGTASDVWRGTNAGTAINTNWTFASREFYGDVANGTWTVTITDNGTLGTGTVGDATLTLYGSTATTDNTYIYTNEYAAIAGLGTRNALADTGGVDTLNASAVTAALNINLVGGTQSQIAGQNMTIAAATVIENAIGGDGNDTITGNAVRNILLGGRGNDTLDGGAGNDTLTTGTGDDMLAAVLGFDTVTDFTAGGTVDRFALANFAPLSDLARVQGLASQVGADTVITFGFDSAVLLRNVTVTNLTAADYTFAAPGTGNALNGTVAGEFISGTAGIDIINGDGGNDVLQAAGGDDILIGGSGIDYLFSGIGSNTLSGGADLDILVSEGTADILNGGADQNYYYRQATGASQSFGGDGVDILVGGDANASDDLFYGFGGDDFALGGAGNDELIGGNGNDILLGQDGSDILDGGLGTNYLYADGAGGSDMVRVNASLGGTQTQLLVSFEGGGTNDVLEISGSTLTSYAQFQTLAGNLGVASNGNLLQNTGVGALLTLGLGTANQTDIWFLGTLAGGLTSADFAFV